jgi:tRNA(Leu) C34 or U34 (ribose-2'-O)-methylase TrmL
LGKSILSDFELKDSFIVKKGEQILSDEYSPSVILTNPKYAHNVGAAVRAASCFGGKAVFFTGDRIIIEENNGKYRLPREERMKGYKDVLIVKDDYPFNRFPTDAIPVAVELRDNAEPLPIFRHPEKAVYVFGPEDGSIPQVYLKHCQRFIVIPSKHCLNLAAAVYLVLYDRIVKQGVVTLEDIEIC